MWIKNGRYIRASHYVLYTTHLSRADVIHEYEYDALVSWLPKHVIDNKAAFQKNLRNQFILIHLRKTLCLKHTLPLAPLGH